MADDQGKLQAIGFGDAIFTENVFACGQRAGDAAEAFGLGLMSNGMSSSMLPKPYESAMLGQDIGAGPLNLLASVT